jgi:SAM-dependent methyltransferase
MTAAGSDIDSRYLIDLEDQVARSARMVVPLVRNLFPIQSVVDVGCGSGAWLSEFRRAGVGRCVGIDAIDTVTREREGREYVFRECDFRGPFPGLGAFDLVVSLEVAEHLPASAADHFVGELTALAPRVLFSAAIPDQGGYGHVNEQWPDYWADRFRSRGFFAHDPIRDEIWSCAEVAPWYAQNVLLFANAAWSAELEGRGHKRVEDHLDLRRVHPRQYEHLAWSKRTAECFVELGQVLPEGANCALGTGLSIAPLEIGLGRSVSHFPSSDRVGSPAPGSAADALLQLDRLRSEGVGYFALAWPVFWMVDMWPEVRSYLNTQGERVHDTPNLMVWRWR